MRVGEVVGGESHVLARLNNWIVVSVQVDCGVIQISASELGAGDVNCAVVAVSEKDAALDRA